MDAPIAVISPVPPAETGIADFSNLIFGSDRRFELYDSQSLDIQEFMGQMQRRVHAAVVFCLGNSAHHINTLRLISSLRDYPRGACKLFLHLHEPVLDGLTSAYRMAALRIHESTALLANDPFASEISRRDGGVSLLRALFARTSFAGVLVHSAQARLLVEKMVGNQLLQAQPAVYVLTHPCFDLPDPNQIPMAERCYDVGVFGLLDNENKATNLAIQAVLEARRQGIVKRALLCGFNAAEYRRSNREAQDPMFETVNAPPRHEMLKRMGQTRVALQLRAEDRGESSGVLPMLLSCSTPVIVSNLSSVKDESFVAVRTVENAEVLSAFPTLYQQLCALDIGTAYREFQLSRQPEAFRENLIAWMSRMGVKLPKERGVGMIDHGSLR